MQEDITPNRTLTLTNGGVTTVRLLLISGKIAVRHLFTYFSCMHRFHQTRQAYQRHVTLWELKRCPPIADPNKELRAAAERIRAMIAGGDSVAILRLVHCLDHWHT
jgi:hypothetical protein